MCAVLDSHAKYKAQGGGDVLIHFATPECLEDPCAADIFTWDARRILIYIYFYEPMNFSEVRLIVVIENLIC